MESDRPHVTGVTSPVLLGGELLQLPQGPRFAEEDVHGVREAPVAAPEEEAAHGHVAVGPLAQATIAAANRTWR